MEKIKVLYVDDEIFNVTAFKAHFRRHDYLQVFTAQSGEEGLLILNTTSFNVVISDEKMPSMTGLEFLKIVKEKYPLTAGIIVTGKRELELIEKAKEDGEIFSLHDKPWDLDHLEKLIIEAYINGFIQLIHSALQVIKKEPMENLIKKREDILQIENQFELSELEKQKLKEALSTFENEIKKRLQNSEWTVEEI